MILVNGQEWGCVSALDRGLAYGDGVFRTLRLRAGTVLQWPRQYAKLAGDCVRIGIEPPAGTLLQREIAELARGEQDAVIKLIVTRGESARGYAPVAEAVPTRVVLRSPLPEHPPSYRIDGVRARVCDLRLAWQPQLAGIKHLNRLENVLARSEWRDPAIAEGLLFDQRDHLTGGTMSNVFLLRQQELLTPEIEGSGVAGVTRARLLALAQRAGYTARSARLTLQDVLDADEVMLCNSLIGIWQVRELAHRRWSAGTATPRLRGLLEREDD